MAWCAGRFCGAGETHGARSGFKSRRLGLAMIGHRSGLDLVLSAADTIGVALAGWWVFHAYFRVGRLPSALYWAMAVYALLVPLLAHWLGRRLKLSDDWRDVATLAIAFSPLLTLLLMAVR